MTNAGDSFTPKGIDEQIEYYAQQATQTTCTTQVVHALEQFYAEKAKEESSSLERDWQRIVSAYQKVDRQIPSSRQGTLQKLEMEKGTLQSSAGSSRGRALQKQLAVIAAIVLVTLLVGSMAIVLNAARDKGVTGSIGSATPVAKLDMLYVTLTASDQETHQVESWTITNAQTIQQLYEAIYALPKSPTLQPTPCITYGFTNITENFHLSFFHNHTLVQKVLVPGYCGGLVVIGSNDARIWNPQFAALFAQTLRR